MTYNADQFGQWMNDNRLAPVDISKDLGKTEQTIYHWRSRGVPDRNREFVEKFMAEWRDPSAEQAGESPPISDAAVAALQELTDGLVLHPTEEQFDAWTSAFKHSPAQNLREWAIIGLNEIAGYTPKVLPYEPITSDHKNWIDLVAGVAAGSQITSDVTPEPIPVGRKYDSDCYALRVFGQSMEPKIPDESIIIVREWTDGFPRKGTIVVYSDGMGMTLKEFGYRKASVDDEADAMGNVPILRSLNKAFPDVQTMEGGKIDAVFVEVLK